MSDPLVIEKNTIDELNKNKNIIIIPDNHGRIRLLEYINVIKSQFKSNYSWIAIEYVLNGLEKYLNKFIKNLPEDITDENCLYFTKIFVYGKSTGDGNFGKLYAPNIDYTKMLLEILRQFDYIICLESSPRPKNCEVWWASLINITSSGIVLVGAAHVLNLSINLKLPNYTIFRNYKSPPHHFIRKTFYKPCEYEVAPF